MLEMNPNATFFLPFCSTQAVKPSIPLAGRSFSCAELLVVEPFAKLKVNPMECETISLRVDPTQKIKTFDTIALFVFPFLVGELVGF